MSTRGHNIGHNLSLSIGPFLDASERSVRAVKRGFRLQRWCAVPTTTCTTWTASPATPVPGRSTPGTSSTCWLIAGSCARQTSIWSKYKVGYSYLANFTVKFPLPHVLNNCWNHWSMLETGSYDPIPDFQRMGQKIGSYAIDSANILETKLSSFSPKWLLGLWLELKTKHQLIKVTNFLAYSLKYQRLLRQIFQVYSPPEEAIVWTHHFIVFRLCVKTSESMRGESSTISLRLHLCHQSC